MTVRRPAEHEQCIILEIEVFPGPWHFFSQGYRDSERLPPRNSTETALPGAFRSGTRKLSPGSERRPKTQLLTPFSRYFGNAPVRETRERPGRNSSGPRPSLPSRGGRRTAHLADAAGRLDAAKTRQRLLQLVTAGELAPVAGGFPADSVQPGLEGLLGELDKLVHVSLPWPPCARGARRPAR